MNRAQRSLFWGRNSLLLALSVLGVVGCSSIDSDNQSWRVTFACASDREAADQLDLRVLRGGCDGTKVAYEALVGRGEKAPAADALAPGRYGFVAVARQGEMLVAEGCAEVELPTRAAIQIVLRSLHCAAAGDDGGALGPEAGSGAGGDASAPSQDGGSGSDAGPNADGGGCPNDCDDGNPCTIDQCIGGACYWTKLSASLECDGVACTQGDVCDDGLCLAGQPNDEACADDNPCVEARCLVGSGCSVAHLDGKSCDDTAACTQGDRCFRGRCWGTPTCAEGEVCDAETDACGPCTRDDQCDDNDPCTADRCACEGEGCLVRVCVHETVPDGTVCEDGLACTVNDRCMAGVCRGEPRHQVCSDGTECTTDVCDPERGCVFVPVDNPCDDGSACTVDDHCVEGRCVGVESCPPGRTCSASGRCVVCTKDEDCLNDSSNQCTDDRCVDGECVRTFKTGPCQDPHACTVGDYCQDGVCRPGTPRDDLCPDSDPCTADRCDPLIGCTHRLAALPCDDGVACTSDDVCSQGRCRGRNNCPGDQVCSLEQNRCVTCIENEDCDDDNACTDDVCDQGTCRNINHNRPCNDGVSCTTDDRCQEGRCVGTPDHSACGSSDQCVTGLCDPEAGCVHEYNTDPCDDGRSCTTNDVCDQGVCAGTSTCPSGATCQAEGCVCLDGTHTLCASGCVDLNTSNQNCGACGRSCGQNASCEGGACKPNAAEGCTIHRYENHDYLVCSAQLSWSNARQRCREFGFDLVVIQNAAENAFVRSIVGNVDRWIGAHDRGNNGSGSGDCTRVSGNTGEGSWYWVNPQNGDERGTRFCAVASNRPNVCASINGQYVNFRSGEPNNNGCGCGLFNWFSCSEGEDCGLFYADDGTWNDSVCKERHGFVCESR